MYDDESELAKLFEPLPPALLEIKALINGARLTQDDKQQIKNMLNSAPTYVIVPRESDYRE